MSLEQRGASYAFLDHAPIRRNQDYTLVSTINGSGQDESGKGVDRRARNWQKIRRLEGLQWAIH